MRASSSGSLPQHAISAVAQSLKSSRITILVVSAGLIFLAAACGESQTPTAPSLSSMPAAALNTGLPVGSFAFTPDLASCVREPSPACFSAPRVSALLHLDSPVLSAPINLSSQVTGNTVTLSWTAPTGTPTAYILEAGSGAGSANLANFSTGSPATTFTAANVPQGTYFVRVRALDSTLVAGPPSNEVVIVVGGCAAPGAPSGLVLTLNSGGTIALRWDAAAGAPTSYILEAGTAPGLSNLASADIGAVTTFTSAGVAPGTYYLRVRARNACGLSGPSNELLIVVGQSPLTFTATPDPVPTAGISSACRGTPLQSWFWTVTIRNTSNVPFTVASFQNTIVIPGLAPIVVPGTANDFRALYGVTTIAPNTSVQTLAPVCIALANPPSSAITTFSTITSQSGETVALPILRLLP